MASRVLSLFSLLFSSWLFLWSCVDKCSHWSSWSCQVALETGNGRSNWRRGAVKSSSSGAQRTVQWAVRRRSDTVEGAQ